MDALLLSRIQFGVTVGLHYLYPITTLGLTLYILIFESLYLRQGTPLYRDISAFLVRVLALVFAIGVATGLALPFAFGANWSRFSAFAGSVFGAALAIEASTAFALESVFLAILVFGRERVSPRLYWTSALLVFAGAHLSAFWIVAANSWLQTPAGYVVEGGRIMLTGFWAAIFNPSTLIRYAHVTTATWLAGSLLVAGIAAHYALRKRHQEFAAALLRIALPLGFVLALSQAGLGHTHIINVLRNNPEKDAAYEGIFHTVKGGPLWAFGIPDAAHETVRLAIGMPCGLSLLESGNPFSTVRGLDEFPRESWPPVNVIFTTFHLMVMLGMLMIVVTGVGVYLAWKKRLLSSRWYLGVLPWLIPVPYLANELGWVGTEIGRQPWLIYRVMRTAEASSTLLPAWQIGVTLAGICLVYAALLGLTIMFVCRLVAAGPRHTEE
jgi:cytochrome d ubiquinol oxidase subunit I